MLRQRDVQWINASDSTQGSVVLREVVYNENGTVASENVDGILTTYFQNNSSFPGKPSVKVVGGIITTLYTYDQLGRIATETDPRGGITKRFYTASGRDSVVVSPAQDTTFSFWSGGLLVQKIEKRKGFGSGRDIMTNYDADGLDTATYIWENGVFQLVNRKTRDGFGRITAEGDALKVNRKKVALNAMGYTIGDTTWSDESTILVVRKYLDNAGRDTAVVLQNGDSIHYKLDAWNNRIASRKFVKLETGARVEVSADSSVFGIDNQVYIRMDSLGVGSWKKSTFLYDIHGNLKRSVGNHLDTTLYGFTLFGKKLWKRDPVGKWMWYVYDSKGYDSLEITLAQNHILDTLGGIYAIQDGDFVKATRYDNAGNLRRIYHGQWQANFAKAEDLSLVKATGYYPSNRVQADSIPVDVASGKWIVTTYEWYPTGEIKKVSRTGGIVVEYRYNARGQKVAELALNTSGSFDTTRTYSYDAAGRLVEERTPGMGGTLRTYDEAGRVTSVTDSSGVRTGLKLDALGRVVADTNGLGFVAKHAYGPNADTLYDRNNYRTVVTRDALGRTASITSIEGTTQLITQFFYESMTDGAQRESVLYPDGTWEVTVTDKGGRIVQKLDKRGVTQSFIYGNDWNVKTVRYEMADKPTLEVLYTRNAKGQVEKIERTEGGVATAKTEYTFDDAGRVLSQKQTVDADVKTTGYAYDMARRSATLTLSDGTTRTKVLDERGRLDSVYLDGEMVADYFYDNNKHTGTILGNGIEATYGRDAAGRLTNMAYGKTGQDPILRHDLGWDVAGQLKWTKKVPDAIADERYGMDKQGQLTEWKIGVLDASKEIPVPTDSLGWSLDSRGNWTNVYDSKAIIDTRTHSEANAINTRNGSPLTYDEVGNLLSDGANIYEWTLDGLLAKVTNGSGEITSYQFDGQRRMVKREQKNSSGTTVDASIYLWSGWQLDQEVRNNIPRTFAYGSYIDDQIALKTAGSVSYFHRSYNQTTEAVTSASGNLVERYIETTPYGGYLIQDASGNILTQSSIGNRSVFQGAPMTDPMSGMVYLRNRWYSPSLGRFVSRDPMGYDAGDVNLYRFAGNLVETTVDPYGTESTTYGASGSIGAYLLGGGKLSWSLDGVKEDCPKCSKVKTKKSVTLTVSGSFGSGVGLDAQPLGAGFSLNTTGNAISQSIMLNHQQNCDGTFSGGGCVTVFELNLSEGSQIKIGLLGGRGSEYEKLSYKVCLDGSGLSFKTCYTKGSSFRGEFGAGYIGRKNDSETYCE